jgi:hypothetical protein
MTLRIKATDTGPFASIYDINGNALAATRSRQPSRLADR